MINAINDHKIKHKKLSKREVFNLYIIIVESISSRS